MPRRMLRATFGSARKAMPSNEPMGMTMPRIRCHCNRRTERSGIGTPLIWWVTTFIACGLGSAHLLLAAITASIRLTSFPSLAGEEVIPCIVARLSGFY